MPSALLSLALARGLLVTRMQEVIENNRCEQHDALDDVLDLAVDIHDGEGVKPRAQEDEAHHDAENTAAAADQTNATDHDPQYDVEDHRALRDRHLNAAGRA